jgi:protease-4
MDHPEHQPPPPPGQPPAPPRAAPPQRVAPPGPQVVQIVAKPSGFTRSLTFVIGLMVFAGVFLLGLGIGIATMLAGSAAERPLLLQDYRGGGSGTIAILPVSGVIDGGQAGFVRAAVDRILDESSIKGVVLRVDSPGGGVTASDQIWYQLNRLKDEKLPIVASYGSVAASGGYYISCHADHIIAEETCTTGSIGVIAQILTMEGLMDKVGIEPVTLVAPGSPEKDVANDVFRTWNERDREKITVMLDAAYETFLDRVAKGRAGAVVDPETIPALANGSIYTARQAQANGLIDGIGYLDDAIAKAESLAGLRTGRSKVVVVLEPPSLFGDNLLMQARDRSWPGDWDADRLRTFVTELGSPRVMYLLH